MTNPTASSATKDKARRPGSRTSTPARSARSMSPRSYKVTAQAARRHPPAGHRPRPRREARLRHRVLHRHPERHRPRLGQTRRLLEGPLHRQPRPPCLSCTPPGRRLTCSAHPLSKVLQVNHGQRARVFPQLLHLRSSSPLDRQDEERRRASVGMDTYNGVYVVGQPVGRRAAVARQQAALHDLRRHRRHERLPGHRRRLLRDPAATAGRGNSGKNPRAVRASAGRARRCTSTTRSTSQVTVHDPRDGLQEARDDHRVRPAQVARVGPGQGAVQHGEVPADLASCWISLLGLPHPDGHSDGRVWKNPEGMRRTPPLFGLAHTHPLHYSGDRDEVQDFEYTIRSRLMQRLAGRSPSATRIKHEGRLSTRSRLGGRKTGGPIEGSRRAGDLLELSFDFTLSPTSPPAAS